MVVIFILGLFWKRASATGAFATLLGGHTMSAVLFVLTQMNVLSLHFTIIAGVLALVSVAIFISTSLITSPPAIEQVREFTFNRSAMEREVSLCWWQDYRLYSAVLILIASTLVIMHW